MTIIDLYISHGGTSCFNYEICSKRTRFKLYLTFKYLQVLKLFDLYNFHLCHSFAVIVRAIHSYSNVYSMPTSRHNTRRKYKQGSIKDYTSTTSNIKQNKALVPFTTTEWEINNCSSKNELNMRTMIISGNLAVESILAL